MSTSTSLSISPSINPASDAELQALLLALGDSNSSPSSGIVQGDGTGSGNQSGEAVIGNGMEDFLDLGMYEGESSTPSFSTFPYSPFDLPTPLSPTMGSGSRSGSASGSSPSWPHTPGSMGVNEHVHDTSHVHGYGNGDGSASPLLMDRLEKSERLVPSKSPKSGLTEMTGKESDRPQLATTKSDSATSIESTGSAPTFSLMGDTAYETVDFASMGMGMGMGSFGGETFGGMIGTGIGADFGSGEEKHERRGTINPFELSGPVGTTGNGHEHAHGQERDTKPEMMGQDEARRAVLESGPMEKAKALVAARMQAQHAQEQVQQQQQQQAQAQQTLNYTDFLAALYKATQAQMAVNNTGSNMQAGANDAPSPFYAALHPATPSLPGTVTADPFGAIAPVFDAASTDSNLFAGYNTSTADGAMDFGLPLSPPYYDSASNASFGIGMGGDSASGAAAGKKGGRSSFSGSQHVSRMSPFSLEGAQDPAADEGMEQDGDEGEDAEEEEDEELVQVKEEPMDTVQGPTTSGNDRGQSETPSHADSHLDLNSITARPLPPQFGGVKGKGGKKGGGMSSVVLALDEDADEGDDWRPSPEEYKKLSSKEKRQLRNKLSARAFRNRRKSYINELEDHITDRDRLIEAIRTELSGSKNENDELKREINALKKAAMVATPASLQKLTPRPSAGNTNAEAGPSNYASRLSRTPSSAINMFNPNKDVSTSVFGALSPRAVKGFWNGAGGAFGTGSDLPGGGFTSVHTALTPDLRLPISPPMEAAKLTAVNFTRVNLNPLINPSSPPGNTQQQLPKLSDAADMTDTFDHWSNDNMFSHKTLDSYRMQIWSRMARQAAMDRAGVPQDARPMFLREPTTSAKNEGAGISARDRKPMPRNGGIDAGITKATFEEVPAHIDQNAISSRLFSAFMSAFKSGSGKGLDSGRLADIVAGTSGLEAVTSEKMSLADVPSRGLSVLDADAALAASFASLNMATESLGLKAASPLEVQERRPVLAFLGRA